MGQLSRKVWIVWVDCGPTVEQSDGKCGVDCRPTVQSSLDLNQNLKQSEVWSARLSNEYCFYFFNKKTAHQRKFIVSY